MRALSAQHASSSRDADIFAVGVAIWAIIVCLRDALIRLSAGHSTAFLLLALQPLSILRVAKWQRSWITDILIALLLDYRRNDGLGIVQPGFYEWFSRTQSEHVTLYAVLALCAIFGGLIVARGDDAPSKQAVERSRQPSTVHEHLLPPLLVPGRTTHSRMFPEKHSFSYSYLYVGIPVGWSGCAGSALSADVDLAGGERKRYGWFNVDAADYLTRGDHALGLEGKLRKYLLSEGVADSTWSFAYLVTAPRFLGYAFNPVSFWYIYDADAKLRMMILEVNNTFDERRIYLLKADNKASVEENEANGHAKTNGTSIHNTKQEAFTNEWQKDFHVSPFNSRKGFYKLTAKDPMDALSHHERLVDNTIVLKSSKDHPKIIARAFSDGEARRPETLSTLELTTFLAKWFWVGFMTFPRILKEAFKLFFYRKLHVWFRPEVVPSSIGRSATSEEIKLEAFFRAYLRHIAQNASDPVRVAYQPPGEMAEEEIWCSPLVSASKSKSDSETKTITFRVLSPAFYSRFVHYAHTAEAFDREGLSAGEHNQTIAITNGGVLSHLLKAPSRDEMPLEKVSWLERFRWRFLRNMRCAPATVSYPHSNVPVQDNVQVQDIRTFGLSSLDRFVVQHCEEASVYRAIITRLFLAQRYAGGILPVVSMLDVLFRAMLVWICYVVLERVRVFDVYASIAKEGNGDAVVDLVWRLGVGSSVHMWSVVKGL